MKRKRPRERRWKAGGTNKPRWWWSSYDGRARFKPPEYGADGMYGTEILARSVRAARAKAKLRGLREIVAPWSTTSASVALPSRLLRKRKPVDPIDVIHAATFIAYLRLMSARRVGRRMLVDILGDEGVLHQLIHTLLPHRKGEHKRAREGFLTRTQLSKLFARLEREVPGLT